MLPPNFLTIPQIQRERQVGSKLMYLTTLLEYLLKMRNPSVTCRLQAVHDRTRQAR